MVATKHGHFVKLSVAGPLQLLINTEIFAQELRHEICTNRSSFYRRLLNCLFVSQHVTYKCIDHFSKAQD